MGTPFLKSDSAFKEVCWFDIRQKFYQEEISNVEFSVFEEK